MSKKKSFFNYWSGQLHLWLGLASGLVVIVIGITGSLFVFVEDLRPIVYKSRYFIEAPADAKPLPISVLKEKAQVYLGNERPITGIEVPNDAKRTIVFNARKNNPKGWFHNTYIEYHLKAFVNPYTGALVGLENSQYEFFSLVINTHRHLLINHEVGGHIIGYSVLFFTIILVTGIVLWWPKNKKAIRQSFTIKWDAKWKRFNYDLHSVLGFYAFIVAFFIAITGLYWAFDWVNQTSHVVTTGHFKEKEKKVFSDTTLVGQQALLDAIYQEVKAQNPEHYVLSFNIPKEKKESLGVFVRLKAGDHARNNQYQFDRFSGKLLRANLYEAKSNGEKLLALNHDIHVGSILGWPGKILYFFVGLVVASLPITGFLVWWGKQGKKGKKKKGNHIDIEVVNNEAH